jgi:hypothetical protein
VRTASVYIHYFPYHCIFLQLNSALQESTTTQKIRMFKDMISKLKVQYSKGGARLSEEARKTIAESAKTQAEEGDEVKNAEGEITAEKHDDGNEIDNRENEDQTVTEPRDKKLTATRPINTASSGSTAVFPTSTTLSTLAEVVENGDNNVSITLTLNPSAPVFTPSSALTVTSEPTINTRHPHCIGSPILPTLSVLTSRHQVPRHLSPNILYFNVFRQILAPLRIVY